MNKERDYKKENKRLSIFNWIYLLLIAFLIIFLPYYSSKHPSRLYNVPDEVIFNAIYEYENNITDETDPCSTKVNSDAYAFSKVVGYSHAKYRIREGCEDVDSDRSGEYWIVRTNFVKGFCSIREDLDNRI